MAAIPVWFSLAWLSVLTVAQPFIGSQPFSRLGDASSTVFVTPDDTAREQVAGYQYVPAGSSPYGPQPAGSLSQLESYSRLQGILLQLEQIGVAPQDNPTQQQYVGSGYDGIQSVNLQEGHGYGTPASTYGNGYGRPDEWVINGGQKNSDHGRLKAGYETKGGSKKTKTKVIREPVYVQVPIEAGKKKKKKSKTLSVSQGFYIAGGSQAGGKFKSLKSCQKACDRTAQCFAGDYDKWTKRCYLHTNTTACGGLRPHPKLTHFKKVPCSIANLGIDYGRITLGANLDHGLLQKGVKDIQSCIKKCLQAGGGVAGPLAATGNADIILNTPQICFGIDYDFATHKCYFHTSVTLVTTDASLAVMLAAPEIPGVPGGVVCFGSKTINTNTQPFTPTNLKANPSVVNIIICPVPFNN